MNIRENGHGRFENGGGGARALTFRECSSGPSARTVFVSNGDRIENRPIYDPATLTVASMHACMLGSALVRVKATQNWY